MGTPLFKRLLSAVGGLLIGLLLLEGALRGFGAVVASRDAERTAADELGDWRVLCLGACYTIGLGTAPDDSYPAQLQARLRTEFPDQSLSVINGGIRSKSIDYFADRIGGLVEVFSPEVIVVNINDRMAYDTDELAAALTHHERGPLRRIADELRLVRLVKLARSGPPPSTAMDSERWWGAMEREEATGIDPYAWRIRIQERQAREKPRDRSAQMRLARLYIERSDYAAALELLKRNPPRGQAAAEHSLKMFNCAVSLGRFEEADGYLADAGTTRYTGILREALGEPPAPEDGEDAANQHRVEAAVLALIDGNNAAAQADLETVLSRDPDFAMAYPLRQFALWRQGSSDGLTAADAFFTRPERAERVQNGFGLVAEDDDEQIADEEAARRFAALLDLHLTTITAAADEAGAVVVLENLSTLPFQQEIIATLAEDHGLPLVDLQGGLVDHPDRDSLFHPTQHLRLSAEGNAWVAEQIHAALTEQDALP